MQINEIFSSIEGEGIRTGYLATFVRTFGCNLACSYCDTRYACIPNPEEGPQYTTMTVEQIVAECERINNDRVTLTGGEPLIQREAPELVAALLDKGFEVNIETNGAVDLPTFEDRLVDVLNDDEALNNLIYTMDYKCPSSGEEEKMIKSNIPFLIKGDVLKFVVGSVEDLDAMKAVIEETEPQAEIFVSPIWGNIECTEIVDYMKENNLQNVRLQLQLHKIIWDPSTRGV